jgi:isopentenyl-diphosphate delta-isomerase
MGFDTSLEFLYKFQYRAEFENGLVENEIDYVFVGTYNDSFIVNPDEVADYKWVTLENLLEDVSKNSQNYTFWFKEILKSDKFTAFIASNLILV